MARTAFTSKSPSNKGKKTPAPTGRAKQGAKKSLSIKRPVISQPSPAKSQKSRQKLVLREIAYYQQSTQFLLSKRPFTTMLREVIAEIIRGTEHSNVRFTAQSLTMLQEAFEAHLTTLVEAAYHCTRHGKRVTLYSQDIRLVKTIKGKSI